MKLCVIATLASSLCLTAVLADPAGASIRKTTNIPAEALSDALRALAKDRQFEILYRADAVRNIRTQGAIGEFTPEEALNTLLTDTGLAYRYLDAKTVTIMPIASQATGDNSDATTDNRKEGGGKAASQEFRVAQVDSGKTAGSVSVDQRGATSPAGSDAQSAGLSEIIVTAQKKNERLQDVPVPVTVLGAEELVDNGQVRLQDYYDQIPGLNLAVDNRGSPAVSIRGISTGIYNNPTVGITVDDVPYGTATGWAAADIDPNELKQIEVLRGPQGSLYGASSIGGLIKYVTVDPTVESLKGYVQTGMDAVHNGSGLGYNVSAGINVPLTDTLAIRASGFTRNSPGYINDPGLHLNGLNGEHEAGGRLSALWQPSKDVSLKLSALYQKSESDGSPYVELEPGLNGLEQSYVRGSGRYHKDAEAFSATFKARVGEVDMTSISGYGVNSNVGTFDVTNFFGPFTQDQFGVPGTLTSDNFDTRRFSQEFRLSASLGKRFDWLLGAFYTHERSNVDEDILAANPGTGALAGIWLDQRQLPVYEEYAVFGDLTIRVTDRFDVQIGGRESRNQQHFTETDTGPFLTLLEGLPDPNVTPRTSSRDSSFTYLVTPRFKILPDVMLYARLASGYRPGGPNPGAAALGAPGSFDPDKTLNYELGIKADLLNRALSLDASIYDINWKDLQIQVVNGETGAEYTTNAGGARSRGIELSMQSRPIRGLTVDGWISWDEAVLTQNMPATSTVLGSMGEQLPYSARFSGHLASEQVFPLFAHATGFVGAALSYVGSREGEFASSSLSPQRQRYPDYTTVDLKSGLRFEAWKMNLYATNIADRRGALGGGLNTNNPVAFLYIQPRTVGLSLSYTF
jgi:iron complex outermembrane receptor protein